MARIGTPALAAAGAALFAAGLAAGLLAGGTPALDAPTPGPTGDALASARGAPDVGVRAGAAPPSPPSPTGAAEAPEVAMAATDRDALREILDRIPRPEVPAGTGAISGRVTRPDGTPVAGVRVRYRAQRPPRSGDRQTNRYYFEEIDPVETVTRALDHLRWTASTTRDGISGPDGAYRVEGLIDGTHYLVPPEKGWQFQPKGSRRGAMRPGDVVDITAVATAELDVTILLPSGAEPQEASIGYVVGTGGYSGTSWYPGQRTISFPTGRRRITAFVGEEYRSEPVEVDLVEGAAPIPLILTLRGRPGIRGSVAFESGEEWQWIHVYAARRTAGDLPDAVAVRNAQVGQAMAGAHDGFRFHLPDLPPGRYAVAAIVNNSSVSAVVEAEVGAGPTDALLRLPPLRREEYVAVTVRTADGTVPDDLQFSLAVRWKSGSRSHGVQAARRSDGTYRLVYPEQFLATADEDREGAEWTVEARSRTLGNAIAPFAPGEAAAAVISFAEPARVTLRLHGYAGSAMEGRLNLQLAPASRDGAHRSLLAEGRADLKLDAEGRRTFEGVQPGDHEISITTVSDPWEPLATQPVTIRPGEQEIVVAMPALHSLTVRGASGNVRASQVLPPGEGGAARRRSVNRSTAVGADGSAVLDLLPEGEYRVSTSGKPSQTVRVPGTTEVRF